MTKPPKVALVHDWLTNMGGAEHLLYSLHKAFPEAPIYTSVFDPKKCSRFADLDVRTTHLQKLPAFLRHKHQLFAPLRVRAFQKLDLSDYDVVISSASAEAKAVRAKNGTHICYCHTPTRYYWSHYARYKQAPGFGIFNPLVRVLLPLFVRAMRQKDAVAAERVDHFIANSNEVKRRIKTYYHREADVIFPPVETERFRPHQPLKKDDYYLIVGRQIPYKRFDLAVQACTKLNKRLLVIGRGSEHRRLRAMAGPCVTFLYVDNDEEIVSYFQRAKAFIFPSEEDFGIVPVEAMSAGTPVIAYKSGGALDYVVEGQNGIFFKEQSVDSLAEAIERFETTRLAPHEISDYAERFSEARFIREVQAFVKSFAILD